MTFLAVGDIDHHLKELDRMTENEQTEDLPAEATGLIRYAAKAVAAAVVPWAVSGIDAFGEVIGVDIPIDVPAATATVTSVVAGVAVYLVRNSAVWKRRN